MRSFGNIGPLRPTLRNQGARSARLSLKLCHIVFLLTLFLDLALELVALLHFRKVRLFSLPYILLVAYISRMPWLLVQESKRPALPHGNGFALRRPERVLQQRKLHTVAENINSSRFSCTWNTPVSLILFEEWCHGKLGLSGRVAHRYEHTSNTCSHHMQGLVISACVNGD